LLSELTEVLALRVLHPDMASLASGSLVRFPISIDLADWSAESKTVAFMWMGDRLLAASIRDLSQCVEILHPRAGGIDPELSIPPRDDGPWFVADQTRVLWYFRRGQTACEAWAAIRTVKDDPDGVPMQQAVHQRLRDFLFSGDGFAQDWVVAYDGLFPGE